LERTVVLGRGATITVADRAASRRIDGNVLLKVSASIVGKEQSLGPHLVLEAMDHGVGTDERRAPVALNNQVGALAEDIPASAITVKIIGEQAKVLHHLHIEVQTATTTSDLESLQA
jgi:hypothetical protein